MMGNLASLERILEMLDVTISSELGSGAIKELLRIREICAVGFVEQVNTLIHTRIWRTILCN